MKGCFILQRRFAYLAHEMVRELMDSHGLTQACAYVQTRDSYNFLTSQHDVPYTSLLLDEDIFSTYKHEPLDLEYLKELELEVGIPTLWQYINADRVVRSGQLVREYPYDKRTLSYEDMLRLVQVYAKTINKFLDAEKPDFLFGPPVGSLGTLLLSHIATKRGIKTLYITVSGIDPITCVSEENNRLSGVEELFRRHKGMPIANVPSYAEAKKYIERFRAKPQTYSSVNEHERFRSIGRAQQLSFLRPAYFLRSVRWFGEMISMWVRNPRLRKDYTTIQPWWYVWDRIKRKVRTMYGFEDLYDAFDPNASFAFLGLHYVPELALLVHAPFAQNEIENARNVAQSLPVGMKLYIKEHPHMVNFRPRSFYKELKQIPNVVLLSPHIRALEIIPHAALVVTITGMIGFEASLLSKPVIVMGNVLYDVLSGVGRMHAPDELPALVAKQLTRPPTEDEELIRFVAAIFEDGIRVDIYYLWSLESDREKIRKGIREFVSRIALKAGLKGGA